MPPTIGFHLYEAFDILKVKLFPVHPGAGIILFMMGRGAGVPYFWLTGFGQGWEQEAGQCKCDQNKVRPLEQFTEPRGEPHSLSPPAESREVGLIVYEFCTHMTASLRVT